MKNKDWNISILVIFILLASSLIWILTSNYVKELFSYSDSIYKYHKSYYISKWWLELALAQINNRGVWFQYILASWNDVSRSNFLCDWNCSFLSDIYWIDPKISKAFDENTWCNYPFVLSGGESVILPLFRDVFSGSIAESLISPIKYKNLSFNLTDTIVNTTDMSKKINVWIIFLSGNEIHDQGFFFKSLLLNENSIKDFVNQFEWYAQNVFIENRLLLDYYKENQVLDSDNMRSYIILSNPSNQSNINFCLSVNEQIENKGNNFLTLPYYYIKVIWNTSDFLLWLDLQVNQPIPSFLANIYSDF